MHRVLTQTLQYVSSLVFQNKVTKTIRKHFQRMLTLLLATKALRFMQMKNSLFVSHDTNVLKLGPILDPKNFTVVVHDRVLYFKSGKTYTLYQNSADIEVHLMEATHRSVGFLEKRQAVDVFHLGKSSDLKSTGKQRALKAKDLDRYSISDKFKDSDRSKDGDGSRSREIDFYRSKDSEKPTTFEPEKDTFKKQSLDDDKRSGFRGSQSDMDNVRKYKFKSDTPFDKKRSMRNGEPKKIFEPENKSDTESDSDPDLSRGYKRRKRRLKRVSDISSDEDSFENGFREFENTFKSSMRKHMVESDSSMEDENTVIAKDARITEVDGKYFQLKMKSGVCVTYFAGRFVFAPCLPGNDGQKFIMVRSEDVLDPQGRFIGPEKPNSGRIDAQRINVQSKQGFLDEGKRPQNTSNFSTDSQSENVTPGYRYPQQLPGNGLPEWSYGRSGSENPFDSRLGSGMSNQQILNSQYPAMDINSVAQTYSGMPYPQEKYDNQIPGSYMGDKSKDMYPADTFSARSPYLNNEPFPSLNNNERDSLYNKPRSKDNSNYPAKDDINKIFPERQYIDKNFPENKNTNQYPVYPDEKPLSYTYPINDSLSNSMKKPLPKQPFTDSVYGTDSPKSSSTQRHAYEKNGDMSPKDYGKPILGTESTATESSTYRGSRDSFGPNRASEGDIPGYGSSRFGEEPVGYQDKVDPNNRYPQQNYNLPSYNTDPKISYGSKKDDYLSYNQKNQSTLSGPRSFPNISNGNPYSSARDFSPNGPEKSVFGSANERSVNFRSSEDNNAKNSLSLSDKYDRKDKDTSEERTGKNSQIYNPYEKIFNSKEDSDTDINRTENQKELKKTASKNKQTPYDFESIKDKHKSRKSNRPKKEPKKKQKEEISTETDDSDSESAESVTSKVVYVKTKPAEPAVLTVTQTVTQEPETATVVPEIETKVVESMVEVPVKKKIKKTKNTFQELYPDPKTMYAGSKGILDKDDDNFFENLEKSFSLGNLHFRDI